MDEFTTISTPDHVALEFELAGLGSRFCAHVVDLVLMFLLVVVVIMVLAITGATLDYVLGSAMHGVDEWIDSWFFAALILLLFLIMWGYYVFFECLMRGRTPGKKQMGIRVIRDDGLPIGFREAALRNLVRAADMMPPPFYLLGGIVTHLDRQGRRLGDMVAGTLVVRERFEIADGSVAGAAWAARVEQGLSRQAVTLPRGAITAQQLGLIEQFCARRGELPPERRAALAWHIAAPVLPLIGEDAQAIRTSPDCRERCEQALLRVLEMSQATAKRTAAQSEVAPQTGSLF